MEVGEVEKEGDGVKELLGEGDAVRLTVIF